MDAFDAFHQTQGIGLAPGPVRTPKAGQQVPIGVGIELRVALENLQLFYPHLIGQVEVFPALIVVKFKPVLVWYRVQHSV